MTPRSSHPFARFALAALAPGALWAGPVVAQSQAPPGAPASPAPSPRSSGSAPSSSPASSSSSAPMPPIPMLAPLDGPRAVPDTPLASDETPVEHVTFDVAVARALARNPTVGEAVEEVRRFHALMEQVRAASLPTLNGYGTYTRLDHDRVSNGVTVLPAGGLNLNVTLDVPLLYPRGWLTWSEASDQVAVARASEQDVRRTVAVSTARAYLAILTQRRLLETA